MIEEPRIIVKNINEKISYGTGMAGKIAMIGAMNTIHEDVEIFNTYNEAYVKYKGNSSMIPDEAYGLKALEYLFKKEFPSQGIESVIIKNITTPIKKNKKAPDKEDGTHTLKKISLLDENSDSINSYPPNNLNTTSDEVNNNTSNSEDKDPNKDPNEVNNNTSNSEDKDPNKDPNEDPDDQYKEENSNEDLDKEDSDEDDDYEYSQQEYDYTLTSEKLKKALDNLIDEEFDILFIADNIDATKAQLLKKFYDECYEKQSSFGIITSMKIEQEEDIPKISNIFKTGGIYKLITTPKKIEDKTLNLIETAAWDTAYTAGLMVNKSETGKTIPGVEGLETKKHHPKNYLDILKYGLHSQKITNRQTCETITNNIKTPTGKDMSVERTRDYIIKDLSLKEFFGDPNNNITHDFIKAQFAYKKKQYKDLKLIEDMNYLIRKTKNMCVESNIELKISDVITEIQLNIKTTA